MDDYYINALRNNTHLHYAWILSMFATVFSDPDGFDYEIQVKDDAYYYSLDGTTVLLPVKYIKGGILVHPEDPLVLPADSLLNQPDVVITTYGRALVNQILLCYPFGNRIPYINKQFSIRDIESIYVNMLVDDGKGNDTNITVEQHHSCKRGCELIGQLTRVLVHSATSKNMVAPTGISAYKKKLIAEYKKANRSLSDPLTIVDFNNKLLKYDEAYMKGDPSADVFVSGKVKNMTRLKVHMAYGTEKGWSSTITNEMTTRSLSEGAATTVAELVNLNNTVRTASYSRGTEIILGGVTSTLVNRITAHLRVDSKDCATTNTIKVNVRDGEGSRYIGRTILVAGKMKLLTASDVTGLDNAVIQLRSITTCANKVLCSVCAGKSMGGRPESLGLFAFNLSGEIVRSSLKSFHGSSLSVTDLDLNDIF